MNYEPPSRAKPNVLVLCTANSARSQMAEGLLREMAGDRFTVLSAGTEPTEVNPLAIRAMQEIGIDIRGQRSKHLREYLGHVPVRHVLIVCAHADGHCPRIWPGAATRTLMPFDDPAAVAGSDQERLAAFCRVRDEIKSRLGCWLEEVAD